MGIHIYIFSRFTHIFTTIAMDIRLCCVLLGLVAMVTAEGDKDKKSNRPTNKATPYRNEGSSYYRGDEYNRAGRGDRRPHGPYYMGFDPYANRRLDKYKDKFNGGMYFYGGRYAGRCYENGLYYMDQMSFVLCSNGNAYVQPCAPGTQNSGQASFRPGYYYGYSDFCDINLVDRGYGPRTHKPRQYGTRYNNGYGDRSRETRYDVKDSYSRYDDQDSYEKDDPKDH